MWADVGGVDWAALKHNYGSAEDVPGLLERCAGPRADDADAAADELLNLLFHQGGWICSAVPAALPFLIRLATMPAVPSRRAVLDLLAMLASEATEVRERFLDPAWQPAWARALPDVLALLDDPEPRIRRSAAEIVGVCESSGELTLPALLRRLRAEDDPAARLELVLALGQAVRREPAGDRASEVVFLLGELVEAPEAQVRLAAVHALTPGAPDLPAERLDLLLEAVRDPSVGVWRRTSSLEARPEGVQQWTAGLLPGPDPSFALGLLAWHPDEEQRIGALGQAGRSLCR
ncbi:HEAT repeat domain-containing protein [Streptomyces sp. NBC_00414]|uniref:HEAT repeat domain-containing protein n=1 Tax=Streptomyces sp. NBC_00414 TaxID=2975739 RepID=UPI002E208517